MALYEDRSKNESLFHAALIYSGKINAGNNGNDYLKEKLIEYGSFRKIYENFNGLISLEDSLKSVKGIENVAKSLENIDFEFNVLTVNDYDFPEQLRKEGITPVIYTRGDLNLFKKKSIGVVGTRFIYPNKDRIAYEEANDLMKRLLEKDYVIVSGMAEGCDTIAHTYAVENNGKTIGVLGTPLNICYPASNRALQERVAKEHLLVSQYPIGIRAFRHYFAERNLTTVSLSTDGIAVIRASDNSGTMHAVKHCHEQNKPIYALANNFNSKNKWIETYKGRIKKVDKR